MEASQIKERFYYADSTNCYIIFCRWYSAHVWYLKSFYAERDNRAKKAEEHRSKHGGESILEWNGNLADGAPDAEFGKLIVEVPKKRGDGAARFYEKGLVLEKKRLPYSEIKDVVFVAATSDKSSL